MQAFNFICFGRGSVIVVAETQDQAITKFKTYLEAHDALPSYERWAMYILGRVAEDIYVINL